MNNTNKNGKNGSEKVKLKNGNNKLKEWDQFFGKYFFLDTINIIEGLSAALVWGILITQLKFYIALSPIYTNMLAYLLSWYAQKMVIVYWKTTELFKKKTKDEVFLKNQGVDHIREYYDRHNIVHDETFEKDPERYHLIDEDLF